MDTSNDILQAVSVMQKNLRQDYIYQMINGLLPRVNDIEALCAVYQYRFAVEDSFCCFILRRSFDGQRPPYAEAELAHSEEILRQSVGSYCSDLEMLIWNHSLYGILSAKEIHLAVQALQNAFHLLPAPAGNWTMGLGKVASRTEDLSGSFFSAEHAVKFSAVEGTGKIYDGGLSRAVYEEGITLMSASEQARLRWMILKLDREGLASYVQEIFRLKHQQILDYPVFAYMLALQIIQSTLQALRDNMPVDKKTFELEQNAEREIDNYSTLAGLIDFTAQSAQTLLYRYQLFSERGASKPIWIALNYIQEHYSESITLSDIARASNRNPQYISSIFTKEFGYTIFDYITTLRMEKAQALLRQSALAISEIASAVGYGDAKYFSRLFSKTAGCSPTEFRNSMDMDKDTV